MWEVKFGRLLVSWISFWSAIFILLATLPGLPPYENFRPIKVPGPRLLVGKLTPRFNLDKAELFISPGHIINAESLVIDRENVIYTADETGKVFKVQDLEDGAKVSVLGRLGPSCENIFGTDCSRPCGVRLNHEGKLVFADMNLGLIVFDPNTGKADTIVKTKQLNDLDIGVDGSIYISVLSNASHAVLDRTLLQHLLAPTGKLIKYNPKTKKVTTLLQGLAMPNGVQLSGSQEFILISESILGRVTRYYLKGPKAGKSDIFIDGLPGHPDNIRPNGKGGYYIPLYSARASFVPWIGPYPILQKVLARTQWMLLKVLSVIEDLNVSSIYLKITKFVVLWFGPLGINMNTKAMIVESDAFGNIVKILGAKDQEILLNTQISITDKYAYLTSYTESKIWRMKVSDL